MEISRPQALPSQSSSTATWFMLGTVAALWAVFVFILVAVVPRFQQSFRDHDWTLPELTVAVLSLAHWFADNWFVGCPALCYLLGIDAMVLVLLRHLAGWRGSAWAWFLLSSLLALLAIAWELLGLAVVYIKALEKLST
jgi:type II secretory pathway component PulF